MKPLSFSEMYSYSYNYNEWYERYIEGKYEPPNEKMVLGSEIHSAIENEEYPIIEKLKGLGYGGEKMLAVRKALNKVPRGKNREFVLRAELNDIPLIGIFDGFNKEEKELYEYKTTDRNEVWSQYRVDTNAQLSFYALLFNLNFHTYFRGITLYRINTQSGTVKKYETARGYEDIKKAENMVRVIVQGMKNNGLWDKRKTKEERAKENQQVLGV